MPGCQEDPTLSFFFSILCQLIFLALGSAYQQLPQAHHQMPGCGSTQEIAAYCTPLNEFLFTVPFWWLKVPQSVQSLSCVRLFATPWTAARQASLSITNSWSLIKLTFIVSVMPSNHLILGCLLLLLSSVFPSIRVFPNESVLRIRWPKCRSFSVSISPPNDYSGLISFESA